MCCVSLKVLGKVDDHDGIKRTFLQSIDTFNKLQRLLEGLSPQ